MQSLLVNCDKELLNIKLLKSVASTYAIYFRCAKVTELSLHGPMQLCIKIRYEVLLLVLFLKLDTNEEKH